MSREVFCFGGGLLKIPRKLFVVTDVEQYDVSCCGRGLCVLIEILC